MDLTLRLVPHLDRLRTRTHAILAANQAEWSQFVAGQPRFAGAVVRDFILPIGRVGAPALFIEATLFGFPVIFCLGRLALVFGFC